MVDKQSIAQPYKELQEQLSQEGLSLDKEIIIGACPCAIPQGLFNKLENAKIASPTQPHFISQFIGQPVSEIEEFDNFWAPTQVESDLLRFWLDVEKTPKHLEQINKENHNILESSHLLKIFQLQDNQQAQISYIHIEKSPQPDDRVAVTFTEVPEEDIQRLCEAINSRIDFQCNAIIHHNTIEMYGILDHIIKRLTELQK